MDAHVAAAIGAPVERRDADWVCDVTSFATSGVSPVRLRTTTMTLLHEDLLALDPILAATGSPHHVFRTSCAETLRLTGARVAAVRVT